MIGVNVIPDGCQNDGNLLWIEDIEKITFHKYSVGKKTWSTVMIIDLNKQWENVPVDVSRALVMRTLANKMTLNKDGYYEIEFPCYWNSVDPPTKEFVIVEEISRNRVILSSPAGHEFYLNIEKGHHFGEDGYGILIYLNGR